MSRSAVTLKLADSVAQLSGRLPTVFALRQRLRPTAGAYRAADKGLWAFSAVFIVLMGLLPLYADQGKVLLAQQSLYLGLLALSLNLLVATTGLISFGHAMFYAFGAYMVGVSVVKLDWPALPMLALAPVIGALAAFVAGLIVLRGRELYFALLTLGVAQLVWAVAHGWQSLTGGTNGTTGVFAAEFIHPFKHAQHLYWFIFGCVAVCALMLYVITRSPFGDALRGIRENRRRAEFAGLWVKRYELAAFVIAGTFGAIAGGLHVIGETQISSTQVDWQRSAFALIAVLIGGTRYFLGPIAGAIFYLYVFDFIVDQTILWDTVLGITVFGVALVLVGGLGGTIHWLIAHVVGLAQRTVGVFEVPAPAVAATAGTAEVVHFPDAEDRRAPAPSEVAAGPPALAVRGMTKSFGGLVAVDNATIEVQAGSIHAVIGPNGAGKTTVFNVITGLMKPDSGKILVEGEDVTGSSPWRLVKRGMRRSFQQTNLFWALTSLDNVTLAEAAVRDETFKFVGTYAPGVRDRARDLLDRVGLGAFADIAASELSHGDQRSLEIATALAVEARLLLLDEPTAGLSPAETRLAVELIRRIAREQELTVLFVEHDMEVVFGIADRITVMHQGAVLADGVPDEIRANTEVQRAYLGGAEDGEGA